MMIDFTFNVAVDSGLVKSLKLKQKLCHQKPQKFAEESLRKVISRENILLENPTIL